MNRTCKFLLFFLFTSVVVYGQDTLEVDTADSINVAENIETISPDSLLPGKYLISQKILWGENGLMRNFDKFKLSKSSRSTEMNIRSYTMKIHEYLGYASLLGMIGTGITGQQLYTGNQRNKDLHEGLAGFTNICYFSTATLSLFQPPPMYDREEGLTKLKIHKTLSIIHLSSMIATNILSGLQEDNPKIRPYHKAAAITSFSSLLLATVVIKL